MTEILSGAPVPGSSPVAVILSDEQLKEIGIKSEDITKFLANSNNVGRAVAEELFPEVRNGNDRNLIFRVSLAAEIITRWRKTEFAILGGALSKIMKERKEKLGEIQALKSAAGRHAIELAAIKLELKGAQERNGIYSTRDKEDLTNARAKIEAQRNELEASAMILQAERNRNMGLAEELRQAQAKLAEANTYEATALERLTDYFKKPNPYFIPIIEALRKALSLTRAAPGA